MAVGEGDIGLVVLRGPCYLAVRNIVRRVAGGEGGRVEGIVLLTEPGRSLTARDVTDATGVAVVATVAVTAGVARTIDAGLLIARLRRLGDLASVAPLHRRPRRSSRSVWRLQRPPNGCSDRRL